MPPAKKRPSKSKGAEYRFQIDAYTPETIPMARLAEYMTYLAQVLGETASVHFVRLEKGSTAVVHRIDHEAIPKVRERAKAVRRGDAPRDATRAFHTINKMLRDDNGVGRLTEGKTAIVLKFPGREDSEERYPSVRQQGSIDGQVIRVGGVELQVPVLLQSEDEMIVGCSADRHIAKQLAQKTIRVRPALWHGAVASRRGGTVVACRVQNRELRGAPRHTAFVSSHEAARAQR